MKLTFYENLIARIQLWVILIIVGILGLFIPLFQSSAVFRLTVYTVFLLGFAGLIRGIFVKRPVVVLEENDLILRGVKPGIWKLFQRWFVKQVSDRDILSIKLGYIREKKLGGLISYPPGEPSRNAIFQMFLWIEYTEAGKMNKLYYPHMKNISNYPELVRILEKRYGAKVEKFGL